MLLFGFFYSIFSSSRAPPILPGKCYAHGAPQLGHVTNLTVDGEARCYVTQHPPLAHARGPLPILFFFHGGGGNAANCGGTVDIDTHTPLYELMLSHNFALVCPEARQFRPGDGPRPPHIGGGLWDLPDYMGNKTTGNLCTGSVDLLYMHAVIADLAREPDKYDTSRLFYLGCSMGSAFSSYSAICAYEGGHDITSWATHSTGMAINGTPYLPGIPGTEPYWPIVPFHSGSRPLKACVFDNRDDVIRDPAGTDRLVQVFNSSAQLASVWQANGNKVQTGFRSTGGHCGFHDHLEILRCLDDGSHRLLG